MTIDVSLDNKNITKEWTMGSEPLESIMFSFLVDYGAFEDVREEFDVQKVSYNDAIYLVKCPLVGSDVSTLNNEPIIIGFRNLATLSEGDYETTFNFRAVRKYLGLSLTVSTVSVKINLQIKSDSGSLSVSEESITHTHVIGDVVGGNYGLQVVCDTFWTAEIHGPGWNFINGSTIVDGYQNETIALYVLPSIFDVTTPQIIESTLRVTREGESSSIDVPLFINLIEAEDISISPENITLKIVKGNDMPVEFITVNHPGKEIDSIFKPNWLLVSEDSRVGVDVTEVRVEINPDVDIDMNNEMSGDILFDIDSEIFTVHVVLSRSNAYDVDYIADVHFTKDNDVMTFSAVSGESSYLEVKGDIVIVDEDGQSKTFERVWNFPFFKNKALVNFGEEIDNYLKLITKPTQDLNSNTIYDLKGAYLPLKLKLTVKEISYETRLVLNEYSIPELKFIKGRSIAKENSCIMIHEAKEVKKVYENGRVALTLFKPNVANTGNIQIFKNQEFWLDINPGITTRSKDVIYLYNLFLNLKKADVTPGDEILIKYGINQVLLIVHPSPYHFNSLAYITEWETFDLLETTGRAVIDSDFTHYTSMRNVDNYPTQQKHSTTDVQKLSLNTGFLLKENARSVFNIINSRKAFLVDLLILNKSIARREARPYIELIPVTAKINLSDDKAYNRQYNLEFTINKKYDHEVYTL